MSDTESRRGSWRWDGDRGELVRTASAEELEQRRADRAAATDKVLAAARDSFVRDREHARAQRPGAARF